MIAPTDKGLTAYERKKIRENNRSRDQVNDTRDIGKIPKPKKPKRRAACERDFGLFLKTYFPEDTRHPWSQVHLRLIEAIQIVVLVGAMLAMGIPRGWGKTFISVRAILWAVAYRHHLMCMLIAASDKAAEDLIEDIRKELETNELLLEDFPEICLPIKELDRINHRGNGQLSNGKKTNVHCEKLELHLGDVNGQFGAVIYAGGITGSKIRGRRKKLGETMHRPTLGLIDDFQTRTSAGSKMQCQKRLTIVSDDIAGLASNDQQWSCLLTCTVIEPGDAADQILDREQHPDWRGIRAAFLESLPDDKAMDLWEIWNQIRVEDLQQFDANLEEVSQEAISERAHQFYRSKLKPMNSGAIIGWEWAYDPKIYVDALEKAMHWYFRSRRGFWSELQNQPEKFDVSQLPQLESHILQKRVHHAAQFMVPEQCEHITAHADVSKNVLWYEVRAWAPDSTSFTIDYGTWPRQSRAYYTQASAANTIDKAYKELPTWELRAMKAVADLFGALFAKAWQRIDGVELRLSIAGIDANDETETMKEAIRRAGLVGRLWPMHSRSFRIPKRPLNDLPKKDGDVIGDNWRRRKPELGNMRYITFDTDFWKTHHRNRLQMAPEAPGSIRWFAGADHRMIADHHVSERSEMIFDKDGRNQEVWTKNPGEDNHLWDVGVGNDVLGSVLGLKLSTELMLTGRVAPTKRRKKIRTKVRL